MISVKSDRRNTQAFARIKGFRQVTEESIRQGWFALGKDLKAEASREILRKPKRGRTYIRRTKSGRRRRHVASAPGETHANFEGRLRRSLSWKVMGSDQMDFGYGVSTTSANSMPRYGPFVEFGTRFMEERPSLLNAINATQRNAVQHFEAAFAKATRPS